MTKAEHIKQIAYILECFYGDQDFYDFGEFYTEMAEYLYEAGCRIRDDNIVRKMQEMIEERCIAGGIYPAFVKGAIGDVADELEDEA